SALITVLPFGTVNFGLYTSGELKFRNRVFPHKLGLSVTNLDVIGVIEDEETFRKLCDQDSIRLCLILALDVIFMGRLLTCPVDDTLFRFGSLSHLKDVIAGGLKIQKLYQEHLAPVIEHHSLFETYLSKLEKSHKRAHSSFRVSSSVCVTDIISPKKWLKDEVICELNVRVFKLETIIQVLARERDEEYGDVVVENELRLCLEDEERILLEQEKNIIKEQRFRVEEAKRMRLEEDKLLQIAELKKKAA
ncbi:hypothetical protein Tco_0915066, partial [Tanacetum coccineum]